MNNIIGFFKTRQISRFESVDENLIYAYLDQRKKDEMSPSPSPTTIGDFGIFSGDSAQGKRF